MQVSQNVTTAVFSKLFSLDSDSLYTGFYEKSMNLSLSFSFRLLYSDMILASHACIALFFRY